MNIYYIWRITIWTPTRDIFCDGPDYIVILLLFFRNVTGDTSGFKNWMTVQFDTVSEKQATTTQRVCEPPRGWNTAQKNWARNVVGKNGRTVGYRIVSLHFIEKHGNAPERFWQRCQKRFKIAGCPRNLLARLPESSVISPKEGSATLPWVPHACLWWIHRKRSCQIHPLGGDENEQ